MNLYFESIFGHMTHKMAASSWKKIHGIIRPGNLRRFLTDPSKTWLVMVMLFVAECVVNIYVIHKIPCEYNIGRNGGMNSMDPKAMMCTCVCVCVCRLNMPSVCQGICYRSVPRNYIFLEFVERQ